MSHQITPPHCGLYSFNSTPSSVIFFICCISVPRSTTYNKRIQDQYDPPYRSHILKVLDMAAHDVGRGSHEEVQHLSGKDRNVRVLPTQRVDEQHKALSHQREPGPVRGEHHNPLLCQDTADHLKTYAELLIMDSRFKNSACL